MQSLRITNYYSTSLYVKPNNIDSSIWNTFLCDHSRCSQEISLPLDSGNRYMKTAAVLMAAIADSLVSWQNIDVLHDIRDTLYSENKQTQHIIADYNKFVSQLTPIYYNTNQFSLQEGSNHIKQQREYIYSHLNNQEGIETLFNTYRGVLLSLYTSNVNSGMVRNGKRLSKQEALLELLSGMTEDDQFIIKDHHYVALSHLLGLPIHCYYNYSDGQQIIRKRVHQLANMKFTVALLFEPGHNNKSAKSVRILYQQHDSVYLNNLTTQHNMIQKRKQLIVAINKVQKTLQSVVLTCISHCSQIIENKQIIELWPDDFYTDLLVLVQSLNFKTLKLDEIQQALDFNLKSQLDSFRIKVNALSAIPKVQSSPSKPKIFQSTYFRNQQAIYNYQHNNILNKELDTSQEKQIQVANYESPDKGLMRPPKLTPMQQTTIDKQKSVSPSSSYQILSKSMDFHDKACRFGRIEQEQDKSQTKKQQQENPFK